MTRTIGHAELRDDSAAVMDALEAGEDFVITRNGRPVGELRPIAPPHNLTTAELKKRLARFSGIANAADDRAETDAAFGEDELDD
ncbi:type II toxin-antitoxin system Phd/YefM family antitoxin [Nocardia zapadnayensis]|uniref:type II toxin-antitoxin system Phd/YefM family antitoxin n=1 Tax=Nocardia rhamnosiphila TaxID=426716 RepID=UPI002245297E|nr:type II toxin-antitoxin system Phd/YefM family antitoxin [Nocardia zapadnayensis]MCX0271775.1 type II toxin-antitoxin system Phd/YefM family antitoxin [Nocardia zapadnayensis]